MKDKWDIFVNFSREVSTRERVFSVDWWSFSIRLWVLLGFILQKIKQRIRKILLFQSSNSKKRKKKYLYTIADMGKNSGDDHPIHWHVFFSKMYSYFTVCTKSKLTRYCCNSWSILPEGKKYFVGRMTSGIFPSHPKMFNYVGNIDFLRTWSAF